MYNPFTIYGKHDDFDFSSTNFPFVDGDFPHSFSNGAFITHVTCFTRTSSHENDFNNLKQIERRAMITNR